MTETCQDITHPERHKRAMPWRVPETKKERLQGDQHRRVGHRQLAAQLGKLSKTCSQPTATQAPPHYRIRATLRHPASGRLSGHLQVLWSLDDRLRCCVAIHIPINTKDRPRQPCHCARRRDFYGQITSNSKLSSLQLSRIFQIASSRCQSQHGSVRCARSLR